ncbi:hypothetical protein FRC11_003908, partial [Ceratobasidium sp. 423]
FAMEDTEIWAKQRLAKLVHQSGRVLYVGFEAITPQDIGRTVKDIGGEVNGEPPTHNAVNYKEFPIIEAVRYARDISDASLLHDTLHLFQRYCADEKPDDSKPV